MTMLKLCAVVESRSDASACLVEPGDAALVLRGQPRLLVIQCPSGCGEQHTINLDKRTGKAWRMYRESDFISLYPSVWLDAGCESHFIIWRNRILIFGDSMPDAGMENEEETGEASAVVSKRAIREALADGSERSVMLLAEGLNAIPWDVLAVCRQLERGGEVVEGIWHGEASFRLA